MVSELLFTLGVLGEKWFKRPAEGAACLLRGHWGLFPGCRGVGEGPWWALAPPDSCRRRELLAPVSLGSPPHSQAFLSSALPSPGVGGVGRFKILSGLGCRG